MRHIQPPATKKANCGQDSFYLPDLLVVLRGTCTVQKLRHDCNDLPVVSAMALRSLTSSEGQRVLHDQEASGRFGQGPRLGKENNNNTAAQNSDPPESPLPQSSAACGPLVIQGQVLQQAPVLGSERQQRDEGVARCIVYHKEEQARSTN